MDELQTTAANIQDASASAPSYTTLLLVVGLAIAGFIARLVIVGYGDRIKQMNPLANASGGVMIAAAFAMIFGGIYVMDGHVKSVIMVQRHLIDPVRVGVLRQDTCDLDSGAYCVVVFEGEREIVVNWHDKRVDMILLTTPPKNPPWWSLRPVARSIPPTEVAQIAR